MGRGLLWNDVSSINPSIKNHWTIIYSLSIPTHTELSVEDVVRIEVIGCTSYEGTFGYYLVSMSVVLRLVGSGRLFDCQKLKKILVLKGKW